MTISNFELLHYLSFNSILFICATVDDFVHSCNNNNSIHTPHVTISGGNVNIRRIISTSSFQIYLYMYRSRFMHSTQRYSTHSHTQTSILCEWNEININIWFWFHSPWECCIPSFVALFLTIWFNLITVLNSKSKKREEEKHAKCHELYEMLWIWLMFLIFAHVDLAYFDVWWRHGMASIWMWS